MHSTIFLHFSSSSSHFHLTAALTVSSTSLISYKPSSHTKPFSHSLLFLSISELLITYIMSRISDLLISSLGTPCKSSSSRSGRTFLHDQINVTGFMEDNIQNMPCIAFNKIISFHNGIMLASSLAREVSPIVFQGCSHSLIHGLYNSYDIRRQKLYNNVPLLKVSAHSLASTMFTMVIHSL